MNYIKIENIIFSGKQNIQWGDVEIYLRKYEGKTIANKEYGDRIKIGHGFSQEYAWSNYTGKLRGGYAKAKANLSQAIMDVIENATNRRWVENKDPKHSMDAKYGWYRYDTHFCMDVRAENEKATYTNYYIATMIVKHNDNGFFLYDIINIKKEARKPQEL